MNYNLTALLCLWYHPMRFSESTYPQNTCYWMIIPVINVHQIGISDLVLWIQITAHCWHQRMAKRFDMNARLVWIQSRLYMAVWQAMPFSKVELDEEPVTKSPKVDGRDQHKRVNVSKMFTSVAGVSSSVEHRFCLESTSCCNVSQCVIPLSWCQSVLPMGHKMLATIVGGEGCL